jgi:hypothetical protein
MLTVQINLQIYVDPQDIDKHNTKATSHRAVRLTKRRHEGNSGFVGKRAFLNTRNVSCRNSKFSLGKKARSGSTAIKDGLEQGQ